MKTRTAVLVAGSLLAMATTASAGNKAQSFSLSPVIGGISFIGDQHLETAPLYGVRAGYNITKELGIEGLFDYSSTEPTKNHSKGNGDVDFYRYGGELLYHFFPDNNFVPYVAAGYAGYNLKGDVPAGSNSKVKGVADYGLGAKYFLTDNIALRGDVRHLLYQTGGETQHAIEYTMGLYIPFGGVTPAAAPVEPEPAKAAEPAAPPAAVEPPPAPAPPAAPTAALSVTPASITKGESAKLSWTSENASKCNIQPDIGPVEPQGSINITPTADTPYTLTCTGAGVTTTSAASIVVAAPKPIAKLCSPTVLDIKFDTNKTNIKPQYRDELKKVGEFLAEYPNAKGVIEGHTDSVGKKASNMKLSQRRADNIRNYIIKTFNIAPERISAKGYGPTKPVASNKTAAGKQKNRRIEANFTCE
jgi:OmpA-OmpF porin, OOP family